ncbi:MAG: prepilin-type N-terminal cleavage/methylation domain-containing protein [Opitutales bacterium]|nr:prepilin-type N-terminal cleavage/methylation domain-containing protein [Opitutales bacterium]
MANLSNINTKPQKGFTIVELMIALSITALILGGLLSFNIQLIKGGLFSQNKNQINRDIRKVTNDIGMVAKESNYFIIYPSFDAADHQDSDDRLVTDESGDFIMFVHTSSSYISFGVHPVEKIVGYYRDSGDVDELKNVGAVKRFEVTFNSPVDVTSDSTPLESLIPTAAAVKATEILELSKGTANGKLFYNFGNKSVMVNAQIYHGNRTQRVTDTYNFTVSPRGKHYDNFPQFS